MLDRPWPIQMPRQRTARVTGRLRGWILALILLEAAAFLGYGSYVGDTLLAQVLVGHMAVACAIASVLVLRPGRGEEA